MTDIPTNEPFELVAGDTWEWTRDLDDYPAGTWTLTYYLHLLGATGTPISITANADGTTHSVSVAKGTTAGYADGQYQWHGLVDDGTTRKKVDEGTLTVLPDLTGTHVDTRSHNRKMLSAIEALLENRATKDQMAYTVGGRQLSRISIPDLLQWRDYYKARVNQEERRERSKNGLGHRGKILTKFT